MRKLWPLISGVIVLGICLPVLAQSRQNADPATMITGAKPINIQSNNLVHPGKAMKDYKLNNNLRTPAQPSVFNLKNVFPKISLGTWPPRVPNVSILGAKNNPYQPNPPRGVNLFNPPSK
ncbi:MAG: hypothetical protein HY040_15985 [Planctomycetes bacterium]|nr:hypothetical protein [Planctomycetota bacterium]